MRRLRLLVGLVVGVAFSVAVIAFAGPSFVMTP